jgi:LysR family transcriptional regulator, glycine cleavage system transcriptional activator
MKSYTTHLAVQPEPSGQAMRATQTTDVLSKVPVAQLRIFEASGRRSSLQAAAAELHLTPSAVSHAIRKMERALGVVLFERNGRHLNLSAEGEALMRHVAPAFAELRRGIELVSTRGPQLLRLHSAPSFATQWLAPRLKRFLAECPGVEVRLAAGTDYARFTSDDEYDADITYGAPRAPNVSVLGLGKETVTPLCTRDLARSIRSPADLLEQNLIQSDNKQVRWPDWFALNGLAAPPTRGFRFDRSFLAIAMAADGLGVALESTLLAEREIASGRLVAPLLDRSQNIHYVGHYLVSPKGLHQRRPVRLFTQWLSRELKLDRRSR